MNLICWLVLTCTTAAAGDVVLLDFNASWCGPCRKMSPIVQQLKSSGYAVREIDIDREPELAKQFQVDSVPCFVMLVDGRETGRILGQTSLDSLRRMYPPADVAVPAANVPRADRVNFAATETAALPTSPSRDWPPAPAGVTPPSAFHRNREPVASAAAAPSVVPLRQVSQTVAATPNVAVASVAGGPDWNRLSQQLAAASVKISIDDGNGFSRGSGTVIDSQERQALVLTCGHIFRDSQGKGRTTVDFTGPLELRGLPARVIGYDLKSDLGLLVVETPHAVPTVPAAPTGYVVQEGWDVVSAGYPRGGALDVQKTRINSKNKIVGPPNLQIAGLPIEGRSGGGLISPDGYVIGVCNAADPERQEGLYAAAEAIQAALGAAGLSALCSGEPRNAAPRNAAVALASNPVSTPGAAPAANPASLRSDERRTLSELGARGDQAEVICIIRSRNNPNSESEVVVIDRATPELFQHLEAHREATSPSRGTPTNLNAPSIRPAIRPAFR